MEKVFTVFTSLLKTTEAKVQKSGLMYVVMALVMMMLAPSSVKGQITYDFNEVAIASYQAAEGQENCYVNYVMSDQDYSQIPGAKVAVAINSRYNGSYTRNISIPRLAFVLNSNGKGNAHNNNNGFYLRATRNGNKWGNRGLYTGSHASRLAILDLRPGDKVTLTYAGSPDINSDWKGNMRITNWDNYWLEGAANGQSITRTLDASFVGDMILEVNVGTIIQKIVIDPAPRATYEIITSGNTSTFTFTGPGLLDQNDYAVPYLTASFGSVNDYLFVDESLQAHMHRSDWSETLITASAELHYLPIAGSFYCFKPTAKGRITVEGGIQGSCVHVFVYKDGTWVDGTNDKLYRSTINTDDDHYVEYGFDVDAGKTYYICINNLDENEHGNAFHLHKFTFRNDFSLGELAKIFDLEDENLPVVTRDGVDYLQFTSINGTSSVEVLAKRLSKNINGTFQYFVQNGFLYVSKPTFIDESPFYTGDPIDHAGTVIFNIKTDVGTATFVATFPYHADFGYDETIGRSHGHIWNFSDPRYSDSNIGNCQENNDWGAFETAGTTSGILSIGQHKTPGSQMRTETDNRKWTFGWTIRSSGGDITDPMYKNVYDMEGDNADMIWETEGLWFETGTNQSCIYNENDAMDGLGQPTQYWQTMTSDPDRYVGLVPDVPNVTDTQNAPSFTIPGLKDGDRVLIYMKSGEKSGSDREAIFFNIEGALDAVGTPIVSTDLYGAGGTQYHVQRYEGCYHFIKDNSDTPMKFTMVRGAICKLLYIQIYSGKRIDTNHIERGGNSPLLFLNDEGTAQENAAGGYYNMHYLGKGESIKAQVLAQSGNLTNNGLEAQNGTFSTDKFWYFKDSRTPRPANYDKRYVQFKSTVGEFGVFRLRLMDMDFIHDNGATATNIPNQGYKYVCDFADRNFTVGYREKMSYPYTWDLTDINSWRNNGSNSDVQQENTKYPETTNKYERLGWDISFWDADGYMLIGNVHDGNNDGEIFSQNKEGFGNQLYANDKIIPEAQGLWFYMDNNYPVYNRCAQITSEGLRFANTNLADGSHTPDWNYKMVVPKVPTNGAVYLRMKRDPSVKDTDVSGGTPFLATKFHFGTTSDANQKTSLSTSGDDVFDATGNSNSKYSFYKVPGTDDEYIVAVLNTGDENHLTFTLNGWIVEKVAVSDYAKSVNVKGYATESRADNIDTRLTSYLTGKDFKTYLVGNPNYSERTLTLTEVSQNNNYVLPAETGCVLFNSTDENVVEILSIGTDTKPQKGFHLFVPDMHDTEKIATTTGNMLKANLDAESIPATEKVNGTDYTNYILTYKYYKLDKDGKKIAGTLNTDGPEIFYRVAYGGATGKTNTAYLPLPTASVDPSLATNVQNPAKFTFIFADDLFGQSQGITTAVENIDVQKQIMNGSAEWYNLNGQKLNGKPSKGGLYIINGKKVLVK